MQLRVRSAPHRLPPATCANGGRRGRSGEEPQIRGRVISAGRHPESGAARAREGEDLATEGAQGVPRARRAHGLLSHLLGALLHHVHLGTIRAVLRAAREPPFLGGTHHMAGVRFVQLPRISYFL